VKPSFGIRAVVLLGIGSLFLMGLVVATSSATVPATTAVPDCTITGTSSRDTLPGTGHRDVICTRGAGDYSAGGGARDIIRGDGGKDTLIGGNGFDTVLGHGGNDHLFTVDRFPGDVVKGGPGLDQCYGDRGDRFTGCEQIHRGGTVAAARALSDQFFGALQLAEEQAQTTTTPAPLPTGPPGTTVTVTVLVTLPVPFPPCVPPPSIQPTPCIL
jgi:hypothetical protein